jgi:hypothetical protein
MYDSFDDGPAARQTYHLHSLPGGAIEGVVWTNDNLDEGVPSEEATWHVRYCSRDDAERATGKSHTGISGVIVEVILDGKQI